MAQAQMKESPAVITEFGLPGDAEAFAALNLAWLRELFGGEEAEDVRILSRCKELIVDQGGMILFARVDGKAVGTCALVRIDDEAVEFAKMGVDKSMQGRGIGRLLMDAAVAKARELGARKILICTHSSLGPAKKIYADAGFVPSTDPRHHIYERTDTFLELIL